MNEPKTIIGNHMTREVVRITSKGIEVADGMEVNDIAKSVLAALETNIQYLVKKAVENERETCAEVCDEVARKYRRQHDPIAENIAEECAGAIRTRKD